MRAENLSNTAGPVLKGDASGGGITILLPDSDKKSDDYNPASAPTDATTHDQRRSTMKTQLRIASMSLLALALLALAVTPSFANSITIYSTGAGLGSGGVSDPNYQVFSAPSGVPVGGQALTLIDSGWVAAPAGTQWINPFGDTENAPAGYYDYRTTFSLTGLDPGTASLSGYWAADNGASILLNGSAAVGTGTIIPSPYGFKNLTAFTITGGFQPGLNTLDFVVYNESGETGLVAEITGTASPAPEPSSLLLMGSGLIGLGGALRRKLKM
jgi:PEP-CTERM motif